MAATYSLPNWVVPALNEIELHLHERGGEIAELRRAGIAESRLSALYPFEPEAYFAGAKRLFQRPAAQSELTLVFSFANVYRTVGTQLPWRWHQPCAELREYRRQAPAEIQLLASRKLLFENVLQLPLVLRILRQHYPFGADADWSAPSSPEVFAASLPLLEGVSEEFVRYLRAHMPLAAAE